MSRLNRPFFFCVDLLEMSEGGHGRGGGETSLVLIFLATEILGGAEDIDWPSSPDDRVLTLVCRVSDGLVVRGGWLPFGSEPFIWGRVPLLIFFSDVRDECSEV